MKRAFFFVLFFCAGIFALSSEHDKEHNVESPSPTLTNFEISSLIDSFKPGDLSFGVYSGPDMQPFNFVCYQAKRFAPVCYFVLQKSISDAQSALQKCLTGKPKEPCSELIAVDDTQKFVALMGKSSAVFAGKNGNWLQDFTWRNKEELAKDYNFINKQAAEPSSIKSQSDDKKNGHWCCGPNSGLRALNTFGESYDYDDFIERCPRTLTNQAVKDTATDYMIGGAVLWGVSLILAPVTLGASLLLPVISSAAIAGGAAVAGHAESNPLDVGPSPALLANYLNSQSKKSKVEAKSFSEWAGMDECANHLFKRTYYFRMPVIVLLIADLTSMHYVSIIGIKYKDPNHFSDVIIIDTNGIIYTIAEDKLEYWMNSQGYPSLILPSTYNTICFEEAGDGNKR